MVCYFPVNCYPFNKIHTTLAYFLFASRNFLFPFFFSRVKSLMLYVRKSELSNILTQTLNERLVNEYWFSVVSNIKNVFLYLLTQLGFQFVTKNFQFSLSPRGFVSVFFELLIVSFVNRQCFFSHPQDWNLLLRWLHKFIIHRRQSGLFSTDRITQEFSTLKPPVSNFGNSDSKSLYRQLQPFTCLTKSEKD